MLQRYKGRDIIAAIPGIRRAFRRGQADRLRARKIERFLSQLFDVAEQFIGFPGKSVKVAHTIFARSPRQARRSSQAFDMQGTIEEVQERAEALKRRLAMADRIELEVATPERQLVRE